MTHTAKAFSHSPNGRIFKRGKVTHRVNVLETKEKGETTYQRTVSERSRLFMCFVPYESHRRLGDLHREGASVNSDQTTIDKKGE
jgi:hypothetical protein